MNDYKYFSRNDQYLLSKGNDRPQEIIIYDLGQHYEPFSLGRTRVGTCPLNIDFVVKHGKSTYRVDRIFCKAKGHSIKENGYDFDGHCYIFIDITMDVPVNKKPFAKKPSVIDDLIKRNKMIITHIPK